MLNSSGFDLWADGYESDVSHADKQHEYPFAGYSDVLGCIYSRIRERGFSGVMDLGFGTGVLTRRLYNDGLSVCGVDFSVKMAERARLSMPEAELYVHDFCAGLPGELVGRQFDCIVATYALHHLTDSQKISFIPELIDHLMPGGALYIGDLSFPDRAALNACRTACGSEWDDDEYYFVFDELCAGLLYDMEFTSMSFCAGVIEIKGE